MRNSGFFSPRLPVLTVQHSWPFSRVFMTCNFSVLLVGFAGLTGFLVLCTKPGDFATIFASDFRPDPGAFVGQIGAGNDKSRAPSVPVIGTSAAVVSESIGKFADRSDGSVCAGFTVASCDCEAGSVSPVPTHCRGALSAASSATEAMKAQTDDLLPDRIRRRAGRPTHQSNPTM